MHFAIEDVIAYTALSNWLVRNSYLLTFSHCFKLYFCLRHKIRSLDIALTHPSLRLYHLQTRHTRMTSVCRKLQQISIVHQTQHTIQLLLQTSDFVGALELIASTQQMLQQELQGVKSLRFVWGASICIILLVIL